MSDTTGIYIHIPFCDGKCPYCDFYSHTADDSIKDAYLEALLRDIQGLDRSRIYDTIYFGGGTPSVFGGERIGAILDSLNANYIITPDAEITVECNPQRDNSEFFRIVNDTGVNRISLGLQSAVDSERRILGRRATVDDALQNINSARKSGIENISVDIMLGIPNQTIDSLDRSLDFILNSDIPHASCYMLQIEEGTFFYNHRDRYVFPDDEAVSELYLHMCDRLENAGLWQYEISNFAKNGFESRHNNRYWNLSDYYGIGASAHSFIGGQRYFYPASTTDFISGIEQVNDGKGGDAQEYIMLQLRLRQGIIFEDFYSRYNRELSRSFHKLASRYASENFGEYDDKHFALNSRGFLVSNTIISELIEVAF